MTVLKYVEALRVHLIEVDDVEAGVDRGARSCRKRYLLAAFVVQRVMLIRQGNPGGIEIRLHLTFSVVFLPSYQRLDFRDYTGSGHPFFLFYLHHLGIFPRSPPTRVGHRRGLGFRPRRSSTIGRHRASEFVRDGVWG